MKMIYLVEGSTGEYSDRRDWIARAFHSQAEAEAEVARLHTLMEQIGVNGGEYMDWDEREKRAEVMRKHDRGFDLDYTGTRYHVVETELMPPSAVAR